MHVAGGNRFPLDDHLALETGPQPGDRFHQFGAAGADHAGKPDDLALAHLEARILHITRRHRSDSEDDLLVDIRFDLGGIEAGEFATDHQLSDRFPVQNGRRRSLDPLAVAQHRDTIGQLHHLVELVGDEDEAGPLVAKLANLFEQHIGLFPRQHRGRLVHEHHPRIAADRLGDFDHLLVRDGKRADQRILVDMRTEHVENLACLRPHIFTVEHPETRDFAPEEEALRHGQMFCEVEFLVNDDDAERLGVAVGRQDDGLAIKQDFAGTGLFETRQYFDKRGFAGAVFTHERMDFAGAEIEVHAEKDLHSTEGFAYAPGGQHHGCGVGGLHGHLVLPKAALRPLRSLM